MQQAKPGPLEPHPVDAAFRRCRSSLISAAVFSSFVNILMLSGPLYMMQVYDRVLTSRSIPTLVALSILVLALYVISGLLEHIRSRLIVSVGSAVERDLRRSVFSRLLDNAVRRSSDVGTQPVRDLDMIRQFHSGQAPFGLFDLPWAPLFLAVTYLIHPWLAALTLGGAILLFGIAILNEVALKSGSQTAYAAQVEANQLAEQAVVASDVLHALGMKQTYAEQWEDRHRRAVEQQRRAANRAGIFSSASKTLRMVLQSAVLGLGAYLPQDVTLLGGTIEDNIARFDRKPDPEAVIRAAKRANVHDLILQLPDGYNTRIGPGGLDLSGGQKQRLALARALYGDPVLIILDEPNANLDSDGEAALNATLVEAREAGAAVIVVAHRPSAIKSMNLLLYVRDGRQVAFGPKADMLAKLGLSGPADRVGSPSLSVVGE